MSQHETVEQALARLLQELVHLERDPEYGWMVERVRAEYAGSLPAVAPPAEAESVELACG